MKTSVLHFAMIATLAAAAGCDDRASTALGASPSPPSPFIRRLDVATDKTRDLGIVSDFDFEFLAPADTRRVVWVETYIKGRLVPTMTWGEYEAGDTDSKVFWFQRYDPDVVSETKSKRARWKSGVPSFNSYRWVDDPFKGMGTGNALTVDPVSSSLFRTGESRTVRAGETYTVLMLVTNYGKAMDIHANDDVWTREHNEACVLVKARFEPVPPRPKDSAPSSTGGTIEGVPEFAK